MTPARTASALSGTLVVLSMAFAARSRGVRTSMTSGGLSPAIRSAAV